MKNEEGMAWLGRDSSRYNNWMKDSFVICPKESKPRFTPSGFWVQDDGGSEAQSQIRISAEYFNLLFPDFCMKLGEGPIRVKVTIERIPDEPTLLEKEED